MLLLTCFLIQECMRLEYAEEQINAVNTSILVAIFTMIALNIGYLVYTAIVKCKDKAHLKQLEKIRQENIKKMNEAQEEIRKRNQLMNQEVKEIRQRFKVHQGWQ